MTTGTVVTALYIIHNLQMGLIIYLEYVNTLGREGLPVTKTQGNWAHFKLQKNEML